MPLVEYVAKLMMSQTNLGEKARKLSKCRKTSWLQPAGRKNNSSSHSTFIANFLLEDCTAEILKLFSLQN